MKEMAVEIGTGTSIREYLPSPVLVDYDLSIDDAIQAGQYGCSERVITSRSFPSMRKGKGHVEFVLIHFTRLTDSIEVLREFTRRSLRSAELRELIALGMMYPNIKPEASIVALGSVLRRANATFEVPLLRNDSGGQTLGLYYRDRGWHPGYWFAAVQE